MKIILTLVSLCRAQLCYDFDFEFFKKFWSKDSYMQTFSLVSTIKYGTVWSIWDINKFTEECLEMFHPNKCTGDVTIAKMSYSTKEAL